MDAELEALNIFINSDRDDLDPSLAELPQQYQILGLANEGGMGSIFKAQNRYTGSFVAIKLMRPETTANQAAIKRFYFEAKAASLLKHHNICRLLDFGVTKNGMPYLIMDWIEGKSLDEKVICEQRVSAEEVIIIARQVAGALGHAHQKKIVHRDLKPENIMLSYDGHRSLEVQLVDFGIAKHFDSDGSPLSGGGLTKTGLTVGTPKYMSPEQICGQKIDNRADIYSLGCVMYFALSGHAPLAGEFAADTLKKHLYEKPPEFDPALNIPIGLQKIIFKALEKKPDNRFNNMEELAQQLECLQTDRVENELIQSDNLSQTVVQKIPRQKKISSILWFVIGFVIMYGLSMMLQHFLESPDKSTSVQILKTSQNKNRK